MEAAPLDDLVLFHLAGQRFALPTACVVEVMFLVEPVPVPGWPEHALGLIDVRGRLIPVLDVAPVLGHPPLLLKVSQLILLIRALEKPFGIIVDAVEGVSEVKAKDATSIPSRELLGQPVACRGIVDVSGPVMVLEPDALVGALRVPELKHG